MDYGSIHCGYALCRPNLPLFADLPFSVSSSVHARQNAQALYPCSFVTSRCVPITVMDSKAIGVEAVFR